VCRTLAVVAATIAAAAALGVPSATGSKYLLTGIYDEAQTLYGSPDQSFPILSSLHVKVLRVGLYWGGKFGVAKRRPVHPADPDDPAYDWTIYDRTVAYAAQYKIKVVFSIYATPAWANGGIGLNHVPTNFSYLRNFAYAAARRYSGDFVTPDGHIPNAVHMWLAWNEPNNPIFLAPQYRLINGKQVMLGAKNYVQICNAIYGGVHATMLRNETVACGVTSPRGNNNPHNIRPSVSPLAFLDALHAFGLRKFDVYAHHPYYGAPSESPTTKPPAVGGGTPTAITLANINVLIAELTRLYGPKRLWITEYGYQTNPPDTQFGVSWAKQAAYLTQAFSIARKNPRIDMMLWFLLKDEPIVSGWQSGLITATGKKKPSFAAFQRLAAP
jgi:hypothetical protein